MNIGSLSRILTKYVNNKICKNIKNLCCIFIGFGLLILINFGIGVSISTPLVAQRHAESQKNKPYQNEKMFYVSLKNSKVNLRKGPSKNYPVILQYTKRYLPVEVLAEYTKWWRIRDNNGNIGWIHKNLLSRYKRTALISPWAKKDYQPLYYSDGKSYIAAWLEKKLLVHVISCSGKTCRIKSQGYDGYIIQDLLWGIYPKEVL